MKISEILRKTQPEGKYTMAMDDARRRIYKAGLEAIGEDVTQQERHWSNEHFDFCGKDGTRVGTTCICDQLNTLKAEQRQKWADLCGIEGESV